MLRGLALRDSNLAWAGRGNVTLRPAYSLQLRRVLGSVIKATPALEFVVEAWCLFSPGGFHEESEISIPTEQQGIDLSCNTETQTANPQPWVSSVHLWRSPGYSEIS